MRLALTLLASLVLAACGGASPHIQLGPECITPCGISAYGIQETCPELARLEQVLVEAYRSLYPPADACTALDGVVLRVHALPPNLYGLYFDGTINLVPGPLADGALAHEAGHHFDARFTPELAALDPHYRWQARGFYFAIQAYWILSDR